ncbi:BTAD domain-containing putative transcriptional regulator [Streptomyces sp. NPDC019443]|uniref:BTAD domain-containing putative transcriptional regulator n=1 Tax=Streptomyces sp. NPDC019443 TaxID=3365061 RepID=UPI00379D6B6C
MAGFRGEDAQAQRERLDRLRLSALEASLAVRLDLGEHTDTARELAALVAQHPLDERYLEATQHMAASERFEDPSPLRSLAGEPAHKTCAESWNAAHPGEARLVSDAPKRKRDDTHA